MGEVRHLQLETISALLDGELRGPEAAEARGHLAGCLLCRVESATFARLDEELRLAPALTCEAVAPLLSSVRDGEADAREAAIASRHVAGCAPCRQAEVSWTALDQALAGQLVAPSKDVDAAMRALARGGAAPKGPRTTGPLPLGVAWRGAVVAVLALAIAFGTTLAPAPDDAPAATVPDGSLVAAVQEVVLHTRTNTLYIAQPDAGAVHALDATTYAVRARIVVGGRPTALALNEPASRVVVLDATAKRLTEIDVDNNTVVGSTALELTGTPTSVQVDNGKIVVSTVPAKAPTAAAPATAAAGEVAVFDSTTKQLETVREVDVAPALVIADPAGGRTLLVSPQATTMADASYRTLQTLVGGVGAAFGKKDRVAVLSADAANARLTFYGEDAPESVRFEGRAASVIALPEGGFAVLLDVGGRGRIVIIDDAGSNAGEIELAASGRGLAYDAAAKKFSVVGAGQVASASLAAAVAQSEPRSAASATPAATATPTATGAPSPSATPAPSASAVASPSASPSPATPAVAAAPTSRVADRVTRVALEAKSAPVLVASTPTRVWFITQRDELAALDTATGTAFTVAQLPRDAALRALAVGRTHVYAVDVAKARLLEVAISNGAVASHALPLTDVSALTVGPDGTVWIAMPGTTRLLAFHPADARVESVDVGIRGAVALAADTGGRVWFSDGKLGVGSFDRFANRVAHLAWPGIRAPGVLLADDRGQVWAGSALGEVHLLSAGVATGVARVSGPIAAIALDPQGQPWYLAPALQRGGFVYGPVRGVSSTYVPGAAISLGFSPSWRAWLADPAGGFYVGAEEPR
jgi:anti-sigma factor RsiW